MIDAKLSRCLREKIAGNEVEMRHVSRMTKISRTTLWRVLHDENYDPRYTTIKNICVYLDVNLNDFIKDKT